MIIIAVVVVVFRSHTPVGLYSSAPAPAVALTRRGCPNFLLKFFFRYEKKWRGGGRVTNDVTINRPTNAANLVLSGTSNKQHTYTCMRQS